MRYNECKEETKPELKFKVGDRVIVRDTSGIWEITNVKDDILYSLKRENHTATLTTYGGFLTLYEGISDNMIEGLVEEETKPNIIEEAKTYWDSIKDAWICPEGYIFKDENGNVINATKIVLEKKHDDKLNLESTKKVREYWSEYTRIFIEIYDDEPNECVFTHLWVVSEQRRKGYGKQTLMQAEEIAKELGCHIAHLKVETNSWMHKWYLRCGYKWYKNAPDNYTWLTKNLNDMEKKKPKYPKTYEECTEIIAELTGSDCNPKGCMGYMSVQLTALQKLLICRDAYWKIAGEEMGLGKPWEPDWNTSEPKYVIAYTSCGIEKQWETTYCKVFVFPTAEMRDAFYENFKELIEQCKELL